MHWTRLSASVFASVDDADDGCGWPRSFLSHTASRKSTPADIHRLGHFSLSLRILPFPSPFSSRSNRAPSHSLPLCLRHLDESMLGPPRYHSRAPPAPIKMHLVRLPPRRGRRSFSSSVAPTAALCACVCVYVRCCSASRGRREEHREKRPIVACEANELVCAACR